MMGASKIYQTRVNRDAGMVFLDVADDARGIYGVTELSLADYNYARQFRSTPFVVAVSKPTDAACCRREFEASYFAEDFRDPLLDYAIED